MECIHREANQSNYECQSGEEEGPGGRMRCWSVGVIQAVWLKSWGSLRFRDRKRNFLVWFMIFHSLEHHILQPGVPLFKHAPVGMGVGRTQWLAFRGWILLRQTRSRSWSWFSCFWCIEPTHWPPRVFWVLEAISERIERNVGWSHPRCTDDCQ